MQISRHHRRFAKSIFDVDSQNAHHKLQSSKAVRPELLAQLIKSGLNDLLRFVVSHQFCNLVWLLTDKIFRTNDLVRSLNLSVLDVQICDEMRTAEVFFLLVPSFCGLNVVDSQVTVVSEGTASSEEIVQCVAKQASKIEALLADRVLYHLKPPQLRHLAASAVYSLLKLTRVSRRLRFCCAEASENAWRQRNCSNEANVGNGSSGANMQGCAADGIVALLQQLREERLSDETAEAGAMSSLDIGGVVRISDHDEEGEALAALRRALAAKTLVRH